MSDEFTKGVLVQAQICDSPIFIIGSPRSGTTALASSLARHSQLWTSSESDFLHLLLKGKRLDKIFNSARFAPGERWLQREGVGREEFYSFLGLGLNALFTSRSGGKRWIDSTPRHTVVADELASLFPGAVFIHILRDGRRVVNSMVNFARKESLQARGITPKFIGPWATDFRQACSTWRLYSETAAAFCEQHPTRSLTVRNEQLVDDPHARFAEILQFLKLPGESGPADHFGSHRVNSSFQRDRNEPVSLESFPNPWNEWTEEQRETFIRESGPTMIHFGMGDESDFPPTDGDVVEPSITQFCHAADSILPPEATVAVVSKGDDRLLDLHVQRAWHFPLDDDGDYQGYHPANSEEAIANLRHLRRMGAEYLVFPASSTWWLDHYLEFRQHLEEKHTVLLRDEACTIYALKAAATR